MHCWCRPQNLVCFPADTEDRESTQSVKTGRQQKLNDSGIAVLSHHFQIIDTGIARARVNRQQSDFDRQVLAHRTRLLRAVNQRAKQLVEIHYLADVF